MVTLLHCYIVKNANKKQIKIPIIGIVLLASLLFVSRTIYAQVHSTNYQLLDYGFGAGGTASSSSTNYSLFGIAGETSQGSSSSTLYSLEAGLTYDIQASESAAPTFTNPSNYYNKLSLIINRASGDRFDTEYAIAVASGSGAFQYIQTDHTLGTNMIWQTYTNWGGGSGFNLIGLAPGTTYTAKVAARHGPFTQAMFGSTAQAATVNPTLSFALSTSTQGSTPPFSINIGSLTPGSVISSPGTATATVSTNATGGVTVYMYGTNAGLQSTTANYKINSVSNDLTSLTEGYGMQGTTTSQSSGGPMEILSPYGSSGTTVGVINTSKNPLFDSTGAPVTNGQGSFKVEARASATTPAAGDYADLLTIIAAGSF